MKSSNCVNGPEDGWRCGFDRKYVFCGLQWEHCSINSTSSSCWNRRSTTVSRNNVCTRWQRKHRRYEVRTSNIVSIVVVGWLHDCDSCYNDVTLIEEALHEFTVIGYSSTLNQGQINSNVNCINNWNVSFHVQDHLSGPTYFINLIICFFLLH